MGEQYVDAGGKRLFVDVRGNRAAPALLYLHGGPGKSCYLGRGDEAQSCRELAVRPDLFAAGYPPAVLDVLGSVGPRWYLTDPETDGPRMEDAGPVLPEEMLQRAGAHGRRLIAQPEFLESLVPLLAGVRSPALLILGRSDLVTSPDQAAAFDRDVPSGRVRVFGNSSHFVQFEEAAEYAGEIVRFVAGRPDPVRA